MNGGVQLLDLEEMRRSAAFASELQQYANGSRTGLAYLGDQNFYTQATNGCARAGLAPPPHPTPSYFVFSRHVQLRARRPDLVHTLDCEWNR